MEVSREEMEKAYATLREMYDFFADWFPFEDGDDKEQMAERFAVTKLNLEIAEALGLFIRVLSEEFGSSYW